MTDYNERLDELMPCDCEFLKGFAWRKGDPCERCINGRLKQAITSLIKELVAEARTDELKHLVNDDGIWHQDMTRKFPQKIRLEERIKELEKFEQNLLKALEEL